LKLYLRLNIPREKNIVKEYFQHIHGVIIEAHVYDTFERSWSRFLGEANTNYLIDPVFYKFGLPEITPEYADKKWFEDLLTIYGIKLTENQPYINPKFLGENKIKSITKNVINYQLSSIPSKIKEAISQAQTLLSLLEEERPPRPSVTKISPEFVIPPYLVIDDSIDFTYKDIIKFNIKTINYSVKLTKKEKIMPIIAMSEQVFFDSFKLSDIIKEYAKLPVQTYGIWVAGLDETHKPFMLENLCLFVKYLKNEASKKIEIINMFGGYFSVILSSLNMINGVVHGLGYGEHKDPTAPSGPVPPRYYNHLTHRFDPKDFILRLYILYPEIKCQCKVCKRKSLSAMTSEDLTRHFLEVRIREIKELKGLGLQDIIRKLESNAAKVDEINRKAKELFKGLDIVRYLFKGLTTAHINAWITILKKVYIT